LDHNAKVSVFVLISLKSASKKLRIFCRYWCN